MNEPTAIIPIAPVTGINALIESKRQVGLKDFANMSAEQLRDLQRRWFADAVAHNVPLMLSLFLQQAGALDVAGQTMVATVKGERTITLTRRIAQPAHLLQVRVNGLLVFNNEEPANELIVPGQWLRVVGEAVEQWQASREARQRADADGVRLVMIETLGADV